MTVLVACVFSLVAHEALAFYNPQTGRWRSRDPIVEKGFERSSNRESQQLASGMNLHVLLQNNPVDKIDRHGLIVFEGCTQNQQTRLALALTNYCAKIQSRIWSCCMRNAGLSGALRRICDANNLTIICKQKSTGNCKDACGWTHLFRTIDNKPIIHICPDGLAETAGCPDVGCTIIHEMTHTTNWSNNETWGADDRGLRQLSRDGPRCR